MKRNVYVVYDIVAASIVGGLILAAHDAVAVRTFSDALSDPQGIGRHPEDFELRCVGNVEGDGTLWSEDPARVVMTGKAWIASRNPEA